MPVILYQQRNPIALNVKDFGATGNGITDDTAAIQSVINLLPPTGGDVYAPPGRYKLTSSLTVPSTVLSGFRFTGGGWGTVLSISNGMNDYAIKFLEGSSGLNGAQISHLKIDGNCTNQTSGGGIDANGATNCLFFNIWVHAPFNDGIHIHNGTLAGGFGVQSFVTNCLFDAGNTSSGNGRGLSLDNTDQIMVMGSVFREMGGTSGSDAVCIRDNNGLAAVIGCIFTNNNSAKFLNIGKGAGSANSAAGIYTSNNQHIITGNYFNTDGTGTNGTQAFIFLDNNTSNSIVSQNVFDTSNGGSGFLVIKLGTGTTNKIGLNYGWTTENSGTASITTGNTSIAVTHNLSVTPTLQQLFITPQTSLGSAATFWVSNATSTQFTINVNANPAQTVTFGWRADTDY